MMKQLDDTIYALATPPGTSALAVVRLSGSGSLEIIKNIFSKASKRSDVLKSLTPYLGNIYTDDEVIDEVILTYYKAPRSYTAQDMVEISCHGNMYIVQRICALLADHGARQAEPGEFTLRAFLNGRIDLSQAEAVADLIVAQSKASHDLALKQMRGGYSAEIADLRNKLLEFASLITLELDFSEEDVEFADRTKLQELLAEIRKHIDQLIASFALGNIMKSGIPVAIIGKPNVGKSTLLNALLNEEKAIVSEIPGTTRDAIEDTVVFEGIAFRFIDTAGLRVAGDAIEQIGMLRTIEKIAQARIILYVVDISVNTVEEINATLSELQLTGSGSQKSFIVIANKTDLLVETPAHFAELMEHEVVFVSAKRRENLHLIMESLLKCVDTGQITDQTVVTNARHHEALTRARGAIKGIQEGLDNRLSGDLLSTEIQQALHYLGLITGEISTEELLGNVFGKFCIGK